MRIVCSRVAVLVVALATVASNAARGAPGDLIGYIPSCAVAPQDIAADTDGTYWVSQFLHNKLCHFGPGLREFINDVSYPLAGSYPTGIAFNPGSGTLYLADALSPKITEVARDGVPTGLTIEPLFELPPGTSGPPLIRGMTFDPTGDGGNGSIYLVEAVTSLIYEVALDGRVIQKIVHPDDPDGFPGEGGAAAGSDVDLIYDAGKTHVVGYYVNGGRNRNSDIRRLEADGSYRGVSIPILDSGGNVSGFLRRPFESPVDGRIVDAFVCVVDSNARFAILEGGEPDFREVTGFVCASNGRTVTASWNRFEVYDRIEIRRGCDLLETLPGTADGFSHTFESDGVYELTLSAVRGEQSTSPPSCTIVIGGGQVRSTAGVESDLPVDVATDGEGLLLVTSGRDRKILLFDLAFSPVGEILIHDAFAGEDDLVTGVAFDPGARTIFVFNATKSTVGVLDETGALIRSFDAKLPNLEEDPEKEPDLGLVVGMSHDPNGDAGHGSLWVVETSREWIYEIGIEGSAQGNVLRSFRHPYVAVEPPPDGSPFGISVSGISAVAGGSPNELFLSGGALRELRQTRIFRADKRTGEVIAGSAIPTDGIRIATKSTFVTLESFLDGGKARLVALALSGKKSTLLDVDPGIPAVAAPSFLTARQPGFADDVLLAFTPNGPYDSLEVERDCVGIATSTRSVELAEERPAISRARRSRSARAPCSSGRSSGQLARPSSSRRIRSTARSRSS
jgi:DNA-binding beta-propeller fold protein YncE